MTFGRGYREQLELRYVDWRAGQIRDPLDRLRFLRKASGERPRPSLRVGSWRAMGAIGILFFIFVPGPTPSSTRTTADWERTLLSPRPSTEVFANVWIVEQSDDHEMYSNGLRIENQFAVSHKPRGEYLIWNQGAQWTRDSRPAGIVYHTTESHLAPFEEKENKRLRRLGRGLLDYVRERRAYHFVIDRFGRVYRVVEESDAANHAGFSVWADERGTYLNLNNSFLGVAFEGQTGGAEGPSLNQAQLTAARQLTEMLRAKYRLKALNCITHAQVSVNASTMQIGWHTDGSNGFPFAALGLPDNYEIPLPSLYRFGFEYGPVFLKAVGGKPWSGVFAGEEQFRQQATAQGMPVSRYKAMLHERYRQLLTHVKEHSAGEENP